jgi:hypothetical protein
VVEKGTERQCRAALGDYERMTMDEALDESMNRWTKLAARERLEETCRRW